MNVVVRIMKWIMVVTATSLALASHAAGNAEAGAAQAATCAACHGQDGATAIDPSYPNLAGQVQSICTANCKCFNPESVTCP
ncbi:MAG: hypothetical protein CM15mP68_7030 [Pseudomonadota bacterium]|nr:MAG: hypothetical protein CM15mP68_7030 [Pseudomonadota bacterium]